MLVNPCIFVNSLIASFRIIAVQSTIDQHLGNLLYYNECVVVPNFGAFLTRYFPAEINSATHMMRPPSKRVAFNARVNENDGLLAKHIASVDGVSYEKAIESIEISVRSWKKVLRAGKKVNLIGIGRLYMDSTGKLQFNPAHDINYDLHSYGLNIFRANAMEREAEIKKSVTKAIEKHQGKKGKGIIGNKKTAAKNGASKTNWLKWVATLGPVAALLLVGSYYYTQERETFNNVSGFVLDIFDSNKSTNGDNSEASKDESSSLSFEKAERLNKGFGPEDDVLSEQEKGVPEENTSEEAVEEDIIEGASFDNEAETVIELSVIENNKMAVDAAEANAPNPEEGADAVIDKILTRNYDDFNEQPLYNVKKRPDSLLYKGGVETEITNNQYASFSEKSEKISAVPSHKDKKTASPKIETQKTQPIQKAVSKNSSSKSAALVKPGAFQIIVGAFSDVNNAQRYVSQLQARGFDAYISGESRLKRVAIGNYSDAKAAQPSLTKIKRELNAGAWVNAL